jgi:putrescine transport system ATP-binding protein
VDPVQDGAVTGAAGAPRDEPAGRGHVRIEGVTKRFGTVAAVDDVSLEVHRGEIFCLLGGSGSGKTTLLRMLAGFETPSAGRILIDGEDVAGVPPYERPVNMMFQSYALFPHMTVEKNVAFGLEQEGLPKAEIAARVADILDIVKMGPFTARRPHQLSGGQRQRVALARSLVKRPKLLLLDEPLGALDRKLRESTQFELLGIQERLGVTFIVVTHDQDEAMTLATRIGVMNHGRIVQVGTPDEIYEFPASRFVADFIGSVNLLDGTLVDARADHALVRSAELGVDLRLAHGTTVAPGTPVCAAIRPEKISIAHAAPAGAENAVRGTVREIAYMGDSTKYLVELASGKTLRVTRLNAVRHEEGRPVWGDAVWLSWHASSPVLLPA